MLPDPVKLIEELNCGSADDFDIGGGAPVNDRELGIFHPLSTVAEQQKTRADLASARVAFEWSSQKPDGGTRSSRTVPPSIMPSEGPARSGFCPGFPSRRVHSSGYGESSSRSRSSSSSIMFSLRTDTAFGAAGTARESTFEVARSLPFERFAPEDRKSVVE